MIGVWAAIVVTAGIGGALAWVDLREHRLPNRLVALLTAAVLLALVAAAAGTGHWWELGRAVLGGIAMGAGYLAVALASPASMGMGDVKLAVPLGMLTAWFGWSTWLWALLGAFLIGGGVALILIVLRRRAASQQLAFGPAMIAGALIAAICSALAQLS